MNMVNCSSFCAGKRFPFHADFVLDKSIKCLAVLCAPFLPRTAESICKNIGSSIESWEYPVEAITVASKPTILYKKVEDSQIEKEQELLEQIRK